ncbi:protein-L-isoaspartate(D-aspartate) O-methyltransferase [Aurantibacillus circumpalustris]|uniref:protein-L-isoaspartate(D-aspartate) O-methyltransferase n=1 Tax=Aurantibacillus circumpalustris TaxID=3036359 RepID=UPI00295BA807|nr:protein-L-isoaspartate(D-aspartate) O-methyltransferase [Aurantibacillus circumpalustris]
MFYNVSKEDEYLFQGKRKRLVEILKTKGIKNEKVLSAIEKIPRHLFFDTTTARPALLDHAYSDKALPIGAGQTISQPYTVAFQTEQLDLKPGEKVLEIGTGCGYQTAVLLEVGAKVYSIERQKTLFDKTKLFLPYIGYGGAKLVYGDGYKGMPQFAPYDKIIVTAGAPYIPNDLLIQLKIGGILLIPLGEGETQEMVWLKKMSETNFDKKILGNFKFVPLLQNKSGN